MSKIKSGIYKIGLVLYKIAPFKRFICFGIKRMKIPNILFYKDFKFNGKFKVELSTKDAFYLYHHGGTIENEIFWKGLFSTFESDTGWIWKQLCKCSDTIIDIGANTGIYSMVAKTINPNSKIYAFEPSNHTFNKLVLNNKINKYDIKCEQIALSNKNTEQVFYDTPDSNQTSASLSAEKLKDWKGYSGEIVEYMVKSLTLSNYIEINNMQQIDLMKIDIEMHEPEAIEGLGEYLIKLKPIVVIEVLSDKVANELNRLIDLDNHLIFHLKENEVAERKEKFAVNPGLWNFIFFHKDLTDKIKRHTTINIGHLADSTKIEDYSNK